MPIWSSAKNARKPKFDTVLQVPYLLLVNFGSGDDAEADGFDVSATNGQMEGTALGLVQIVDVGYSRVA